MRVPVGSNVVKSVWLAWRCVGLGLGALPRHVRHCVHLGLLGLNTIKYSTQQLLSVWDSVGTHYNSLLANIGSHRQPRSQSTSRPNMVATQRDYEQAEVQRKLWNLLPMLPIFIVQVPKYSKCWQRSQILWRVTTALGSDHRTLCEKMTARWINAWAA